MLTGDCFSGVIVFPVDGLLGDSDYPRDDGEANVKGARKNYTTIWGGNYYLGNYLDRGKGTGAHPGVDITGATGEKVYAIAKGKVIINESNTGGWGGLIVIRHLRSDFGQSGPNYYSIYAHLRKRENINIGTDVEAGRLIGLIGGDRSDPDHGSSTGRHLHFQIDIGYSFYRTDQPDYVYEKGRRLDPHYVLSRNPPNTESYDPELVSETMDPIKFIESNYQYFVGKSQSYGWKFQNTTGSQFWSEPFADCYRFNGGMEALGYPTNNVYLSTNFSGYSSSGSPAVYVQDLNKNGHIFSLVLNPYVANSSYGNKLGVAFPIHGAIRTNWIPNFRYLGPAVSNEYYYYMNNVCSQANKRVVQWFEPSDNNFVCMVYNPNTLSAIFGSSSYTRIPLDENRIKQDVVSNSKGGQGGGQFLSPPYNLQADTVDNHSIQLTWTLPNGTDDYNIKIYNNGVLLKNFSAIDSIIINGLSANTTYCFQASLFCNSSGEESAKSAEVCATTNINPPPPPQNWTIANERVTTQVNSSTYQPIDEKYSYEKSVGQYLNYWVKLDSNNSGLNFEWRLFYTFDNSRVWNAQTSSNQPAYLCQKYSYFDSANQDYYVWHKIEANTLPYVGQYRIELWIDGQKASSRCFDLTLPAPDYFRLDGTPTKTSTTFRWLGLGDNSVSGSGVELFMGNNRIAFISGYSNGYTIASDVCGTHDFRIREVNVYPAGTFRSPFSAPLSVMVKLNKVTGTRITN